MRKSDLIRFSVWFAWYTTKARAESRQPAEYGYAAQLQEDALAVLRLAGRHQRLCELQCSWSGWGENNDAEVDAVEAKLQGIAGRLGMGCELQRDPRGATVRLAGMPVPAQGYSAAQINRIH